MRRLLWFSLALTAFLAVPRMAAAQHALCISGGPVPCAKPSAGPWNQMTFGSATFVKPEVKPVKFVPGSHGLHTVKGTSGIATAFGPMAPEVPAIDCAMAKPAQHNYDPAMVKPPPPMPRGHGGVLFPIAPCQKK